MKTTLKEAFYRIDDDLINLKNDNFSEKIDIDISKIKADVFSQLDTESKKKISGKKTTKKLTIMLIAAVLFVVMAAGTIYAFDSIQQAFKEFFGGNMNSAGFYNGRDVTFTSPDPNLNVQVLGVTGDEQRVYAVLEVTHKDGTAITEEGYNEPYWWTDDFSNMTENETVWDYYGCTASYTDKNDNTVNYASIVDYSLSEDRKSLKLLFMILSKENDLQDTTLSVVSESFGARKICEVLDEKVNKDDEYDIDKIEKRQNELGIDNNNQCSQIYNGDKYQFCYIDHKKFELPFEISFKLNISNENNITKPLTSSEAPNFITSNAKEVEMEITSFGINFYGKCDLEVYENCHWTPFEKSTNDLCYEHIDVHNSKLIMNNGTEYYLYHYPGGNEGVVEDGKNSYYEENIVLTLLTPTSAPRELELSDTPAQPSEPKIHLIDTREIKTIIINGDVVYGK